MLGFDESRKTIVVHESKYMILCHFECVLCRIVHVIINLGPNLCIQAYLCQEAREGKKVDFFFLLAKSLPVSEGPLFKSDVLKDKTAPRLRCSKRMLLVVLRDRLAQ